MHLFALSRELIYCNQSRANVNLLEIKLKSLPASKNPILKHIDRYLLHILCCL